MGHPVHTLLMTATPIPRTLALAQYGSLVLSSINEMPPGRRAIETHVVVDSAEGREEVSRGERLTQPLCDSQDTRIKECLSRCMTVTLSMGPSCQVYKVIRDELASGGRIYIVCPLVSSTTAGDSGGAGGDSSSSNR